MNKEYSMDIELLEEILIATSQNLNILKNVIGEVNNTRKHKFNYSSDE